MIAVVDPIAEVLEGKRKIHCHSYRKDEILQMIRTAEEFGVQVSTFQHVLEGYKVADEIARHGAGASGFSDWWAYKYEVIDAIDSGEDDASSPGDHISGRHRQATIVRVCIPAHGMAGTLRQFAQGETPFDVINRRNGGEAAALQ